MSRRGVSLAELLVAALLGAVVVGASLAALTAVQRAGQRQVEVASRNLTMLHAAHLLRTELAGASAQAGDLAGLGRDRLRYRATRGTGRSCGSTPGGLLVASASLRALRLPAAGRDSALWLRALDSGLAWTAAPVSAAPRAALCPGGEPAMLIPVSADSLDRVLVPGIVAFVEEMEVRGYLSGADWWLGLRSIGTGESIQPVAGPFAARGIVFEPLDDTGSPTTDPMRVRRLRVFLRATASSRHGIGGAARASTSGSVDSLLVEVPLRGGPP